jgi:aminopeptidase-like protein
MVLQTAPEATTIGTRMHGWIEELFPICRSITGSGVRQTLDFVGRHLPLEVHEVPTGTQVFDWTVPREWNLRDAWIKNPRGEKVVDWRQSNLHVVSYSTPVRCKLSLEELRRHLYSLPQQPDWIPYRTSYYQENWGFCVAQRELDRWADGEYDVCIDATLEPGSLTYGECFLPGESEQEVLLSCHVCHPSLANDNLSGVALLMALGEELARAPRKLSYRLLFVPGTIGAITWLARNASGAERIVHGLVVACVGDPGAFHYKRSRRGNAVIDRAVAHVLRHSDAPFQIRDFSPYGYDERQYCSPGFNLPVGSLTRTPHGRYAQYHTSADDLDFVTPDALAGSLAMYRKVLQVLEHNVYYRNLQPHCEPQLGKRGLYRAIGGLADAGQREMAMLWVLNLADGEHSLLDMAERADLPFDLLHEAARTLVDHHLLCECAP